MHKVDKTLFGQSGADSDKPPCPKCGAPLNFKSSKSGPFYGCSNYPKCDFSKPLHDAAVELIKVIDDANCPLCTSALAVKKGRYGLFIGCTNYPDCHYIGSLHESKDANITCPACKSGELKQRTNRYGKTFYSCTDYPKCRYVLNSEPINETCPNCGWAVLIKKQGKISCPQKQCGYERDDTN